MTPSKGRAGGDAEQPYIDTAPRPRAYSAHATRGARIGPNAIVQPFAALQAAYGDGVATEVLTASTPYTPSTLPADMVYEREAASMLRAIAARWPGAEGAALLRRAGELTGAYLLRHRIPTVARAVIRTLPRVLGVRVLASAMRRHAWTFAGSGTFTVRHGRETTFTLAGCPLCTDHRVAAPWCEYYAGALEHLLRELVDRRARVVEVDCEAAGGTGCRFVARR